MCELQNECPLQLSNMLRTPPEMNRNENWKKSLSGILRQNSLEVKSNPEYSSDYTIPYSSDYSIQSEQEQSELYEEEEDDEYINVVPEDKIINQLLQRRPSMNDVGQEFEEERQRRMYNMLRHSSHYKKIQVCLLLIR